MSHSFKDHFTIVPILVGSLNPDQEALYGRLLANYFTDPQNLFVISSDFCHWGHRFNYTYYDRSCGQIYKSIEKLDKQVGNQSPLFHFLRSMSPSFLRQKIFVSKSISICHSVRK